LRPPLFACAGGGAKVGMVYKNQKRRTIAAAGRPRIILFFFEIDSDKQQPPHPSSLIPHPPSFAYTLSSISACREKDTHNKNVRRGCHEDKQSFFGQGATKHG